MDADDIAHPDRLRRQWEVIQNSADVAVVGTLCNGIDATGREVRPRDRWRLVRRSGYIPFPHGSAMFRREVFDRVGGYDETAIAGEDQHLFSKMAAHGRIVTLPDVLYSYRYHSNNATLFNGLRAIGENHSSNGESLAALGFPAFLGPLLCERGFSRLAPWRSQSWTKRALSVFAAMKRTAPAPLKKLYYQTTPVATTHRLARPTMLPAYDWQNTRAFSLPTDQYGWIRVNLTGRESEGIVPAGEYEKLCSELIEMLSTLASENGELLVEDVTRTAADTESAFVNPLPDLVVHWRDAAFASSLKIRGSAVPAQMVSKKSTGQHALRGFCIYRGNADAGLDGVIAAKDLWRLIAASL